jgi:peroxiredoxin
LIHAPKIHKELELTKEQISKLQQLFKEIDGTWFRSRILPSKNQKPIIEKLEQRVFQWFEQNTSESQQRRLGQLDLQSQGIRMLLRDDLKQQLNLDQDQYQAMLSLAQATHKVQLELNQANARGTATEQLETALREAAAKEKEALKKVVRDDQLQKLGTLMGERFETSQLQRIFPMAPELIQVKHWINSEPLTLRQLRGRVVVVHFYAFQCHNCQANFEHYRRWHENLKEKGVVVIGIQTPETQREQDPSAVRSAATKQKLLFPILVDLDKANWKSWANTMWPSIYVIDQDGYLRHWWQGELNWKGATGDQTIDRVVQQLLSESTTN